LSEFETKEIFVRSYPKVIFLTPLWLTSLILWIIQWIMMQEPGVTEPNATLANIWMWMFFANLFVMSFDSPTGKFFMILIGIIVGALLVFLYVAPKLPNFNIKLLPVFYGFMTVILGIILLMAVIEARFEYWKFEKNEIIHKEGLFAAIKRFPTSDFRYKKEIPDVFEWIIAGAGSLTLYLQNTEPVVLPTVPRINKISKELDQLLSQFRVNVVR